jgi:hypothetical protein
MFASPTIGARRTAKFWIPLMAMYTGGRLTELTQLFVGDVKSTPDGSHYLDFVHDPSSARFTKTKKTRQVPVHPDLLRCGFLEFVGWRRNQAEGDINARLFGELTIGPKGRSVWTCRGLVPVT